MSLTDQLMDARQKLLDNGAKDDFIAVMNMSGWMQLVAELNPVFPLPDDPVFDKLLMEVVINCHAGQMFYVFERQDYMRLFDGLE